MIFEGGGVWLGGGVCVRAGFMGQFGVKIRMFVDGVGELEELVCAKGAVDGRYHYLCNVMRVRVGQKVVMFNGVDEVDFVFEVMRVDAKSISLKLCNRLAGARAKGLGGGANNKIITAFCLVKNNQLADILRPCTELGSCQFVPIVSNNCQAREINLERARAIVIEASEQCGRFSIPKINAPVDLKSFLVGVKSNDTILFCNETQACSAGFEIGKAKGDVITLVGPEGGFCEKEISQITAHAGVKSISLGPNILKASTACIAITSLVVGMWAS